MCLITIEENGCGGYVVRHECRWRTFYCNSKQEAIDKFVQAEGLQGNQIIVKEW